MGRFAGAASATRGSSANTIAAKDDLRKVIDGILGQGRKKL
jgi:hypothetical protein